MYSYHNLLHQRPVGELYLYSLFSNTHTQTHGLIRKSVCANMREQSSGEKCTLKVGVGIRRFKKSAISPFVFQPGSRSPHLSPKSITVLSSLIPNGSLICFALLIPIPVTQLYTNVTFSLNSKYVYLTMWHLMG